MTVMRRRATGIALAVLGLAASLPAAAQDSLPPPPELQLRLLAERTALRAEDTTRVRLWLLNPSGQELRDVKAYFAAPSFIDVHEDSCAGPAVRDSLLFPRIGPGELVRKTLCLRVQESVREGDVVLGVLVGYGGRWARGERARLVAAEAKLKVGLFGTETVAGVSLGLLALVVPGLLLLLLLKSWGVWAPGGTEQSVATVLASLALGWVLARLSGHDPAMVSTTDFFKLCIMAVVVASLVAVLVRAARAFRLRAERERREEEIRRSVPARSDPLATILRKLIAAHPSANSFQARPRTRLRNTADGTVLVGSLAMDAGEGWVLAGYFDVTAAGEAAALLRGARDPRSLAELVERLDPPVAASTSVEIEDGGAYGADVAWLEKSRWELLDESDSGGPAPVLTVV